MSEFLRCYIFIDALGWEIVEKYGFATDFLPVRHRVRTQLGYSAGAVPTILSGESPEKHRHFSFFYYDKANSPFRFLRFLPSWLLPDAIFSRHRIRHHISKWLKKLLGYTGYFQLYRVPFKRLPVLNYSEKSDIFAPGGLGGVKNLADAWQGQKYLISNWRNPGPYNFDEAAKAIEAEKVEYIFLYCAELDGFLHLHVSEPEAVRAELKKYEEKLRGLLELANRHYQTVEFAVISDHGMTPLTRTLDLRGILSEYRWGQDYVSFTDSTMARFWWTDPAKKAELMRRIEEVGSGHWLTEDELKKYNIDFPDRQYGDAIYLLDAGAQFAPSDMGGKALPGMHGFSPDDPDSDACFLSNRRPPIQPLWIGDYFRLMTWTKPDKTKKQTQEPIHP